MGRALDALDATSDSKSGPTAAQMHFGTGSAPDLSFTSVKHASVDGHVLQPVETYWNSILLATVRAVVKHGGLQKQIASKLLVNYVVGQKGNGGYKYIAEADLSVQGQDANGAWKAISFLAKEFGINVEIEFTWQNNPKAANPGLSGNLSVGGVFE